MTALLLGSTLLLLYTYVGYPVSLGLFARLFPQSHKKDESLEPSVTLIISAYNEEKTIGAKLENALQLDYPPQKLTVIVVSDASTDNTDRIILSFSHNNVVLIRSEERAGKTAGLNMAMERVVSDLVVFSDANALYDRNALRKMVRHFADDRVGYVVGEARYEECENSAAGQSEGAYWDLEVRLKEWESAFSSVVGGDGALYAIRSELWEPLRDTDINDFVNPLQIVARGFRGIFDPEAVCFEKPAGDFQKELGRKVRIANRSINGILRVPQVLNILKGGRFAWQVVSHKLLRWLSPYIMALHFLFSLGATFTGAASPLPLMFLSLYGATALLALIGYRKDRNAGSSSKFFYLPYYFYLMNIAAAIGVWLRLKGEIIITWETVREGSSLKPRVLTIVPALLFVVLGGSLLGCVVGLGLGHAVLIFSVYLLMGMIFFTYLGYPLVLGIMAGIFPVSANRSEEYFPAVTLLIAAYNEADVIGDKLLNSLELDYPSDRLRIVVASDGSTDGTDEIVGEFSSRGIELFKYEPNRGKISVLNQAMESMTSEIVLFSDANVMYEPQALRKMVRHFHDPRVGAVSGKVVLINETASYRTAESGYYRIEHYIQQKEGATGAMIGADGAMYAIRRSLFHPPAADTILDDFVISMEVVRQGYWLLHEKEAVGFEKNLQEINGEFRRKTRIIAGGIQCLRGGRGIPSFDTPLLMFKFISHKLLRWLIGPITVLLLLLASIGRIGGSSGYLLSLALCALLCGLIITAIAQMFPAAKRFELVTWVHYLFMLKFASLLGCYKGITGGQKVTWRG